MESSNWDEIKQAIINDAVDIKKQTLKKAVIKIKQMFDEEGIKVSISESNNKIFYEPDSAEDLDLGRRSFQKIVSEINNHRNWLDTI